MSDARSLEASATKEWCWPFRHDWAKWKDISYGKTYMDSPDEYTGQFITQERRCKVCAKVQLRKATSS